MIGRPREQSLSFIAAAQSGGLLPRTYVSPPDRQSPLVYAACTQRRVPHTDTVTGRRPVRLPCRRAGTRKNAQHLSTHARTKMLTYACMQENDLHTHPRHECIRTQNRHILYNMCRHACRIHTYMNTHNSCFLSLAGITTQASPDPGILCPTCSRHALLTGLCHKWDVYSPVCVCPRVWETERECCTVILCQSASSVIIKQQISTKTGTKVVKIVDFSREEWRYSDQL